MSKKTKEKIALLEKENLEKTLKIKELSENIENKPDKEELEKIALLEKESEEKDKLIESLKAKEEQIKSDILGKTKTELSKEQSDLIIQKAKEMIN